MPEVRIVDVRDAEAFAFVPPCADPSFDHRTCDYWEDGDRGSKAHRASWLSATAESGSGPSAASPSGPPANLFAPPPSQVAANPFAPASRVPANPFVPPPKRAAPNPFALDDDDDDRSTANPFAPVRHRPAGRASGGPRKLTLLGRGLAVFGSYAKVLLLDGMPAAYAQFGPLSAYPRALRLRQLYRQLPDAPLPAVITCVATTAEARGGGLGRRLVEAVCDDLATRGFAAVEAYPEVGARPDATSAAAPEFWIAAGFVVAAPDERFPVLRRELE